MVGKVRVEHLCCVPAGNALFCVYGGPGESAMLPERLTPD
jgi:hypothetical protein